MPRRALAIILLFWLPGAAQSPGPPMQMPDGMNPRNADQSMSFPDVNMESKRVQMLNVMRQKAMVTDAEKLLRLAREINADLNANSATMSPATRMQKMDEIEKLARNVKEKMTYAVGHAPDAGPYTVWQR
jgi:hypothetical protein